jgi:poly-gamma-glutamate synthesis protein (capsule biosynthesis protein)
MNRSTILKIITALIILLAVAIAIHSRFPAFLGSRTSITKFTDDSDGSLDSYYERGQDLSPRGQVATTSATFLAVGDIMLSRDVAGAIIKAKNIDYPFLNFSDTLKSTDFNFANLESPVAPKKPIVGGSTLIFGAASSSLQALKDYNFQIVNLANNHAFDQGLAGVDVTRSTLDGLGIAHEGTGDNLDEAWTPAVVTDNDIKICFIGASFSSLNDGGKAKNDFVARIEDTDRLQSAIRNSQSICDFIVVTMHAGTEYTRAPNNAQVAFAHAAIDDGADIVIGAHPHWVQTIEKYQGKYIFYSLGNFVFDQNFSQDTKQGLVLKIQISKNQTLNQTAPGAASLDDLQGSRIKATLDSIELLPIAIINSQPELATADEGKSILNQIKLSTFVLYP